MIFDPSPVGTLEVLFKWKKAALGVFFFVVVAAIGYLFLASHRYESEAELIVRFGRFAQPEPERGQQLVVASDERSEVALANAEILQSPHLARETIEAIGLEKIYPEIADNPPSNWFPGNAMTPMDAAVNKFDKNLIVDVGLKDNVISLGFLHPDKSMAQQVAKKLIDLYIQQQTQIYENPQYGFLASSVAQSHARLASAQSALEAFKGKWKITDIDQEVATLLKQRSDVQVSLSQAEAVVQQALHRQEDLRKLLLTIDKTVPTAATGDKYRALDDAQTRLSDLRNKESQMLGTYAPSSVALAQIRAGIAEATADVRRERGAVISRESAQPNTVYQQVQTDYLRAAADAQSGSEPVRVLTAELSDINKRLSDLQEARGPFNDLSRTVDIENSAFRTLSDRAEDARVKEKLNVENISPATVISPPTLPSTWARPRILIVLVVSVFGGIVLGVGFAFVLEALDDRFTTGAQVTARLALPILATFGPVPGVAKPHTRM